MYLESLLSKPSGNFFKPLGRFFDLASGSLLTDGILDGETILEELVPPVAIFLVDNRERLREAYCGRC